MAVWCWLVFAIVFVTALAAFLLPSARILQRSGRSPFWLLLTFVPFGTLIGLWLFAYTLASRRSPVSSGEAQTGR